VLKLRRLNREDLKCRKGRARRNRAISLLRRNPAVPRAAESAALSFSLLLPRPGLIARLSERVILRVFCAPLAPSPSIVDVAQASLSAASQPVPAAFLQKVMNFGVATTKRPRISPAAGSGPKTK
jgi:hypothetical protein